MIEKESNWLESIFELVRKIPRGRVCTYGILAEYVGTKATARMVGWAMNASHNYKPNVPAHRVVNRKGMLTGKNHFASPTQMQEMLEVEGIVILNDQVQNFKEICWYPYENK